MQGLVDEGSPDATVIRGVLANPNMLKSASLYEALESAEARRIARRLTLHDTPKHGSWLNMADDNNASTVVSLTKRRYARHRGLGTPAQHGAGDY
jgi:hypothetical protein